MLRFWTPCSASASSGSSRAMAEFFTPRPNRRNTACRQALSPYSLLTYLRELMGKGGHDGRREADWRQRRGPEGDSPAAREIYRREHPVRLGGSHADLQPFAGSDLLQSQRPYLQRPRPLAPALEVLW